MIDLPEPASSQNGAAGPEEPEAHRCPNVQVGLSPSALTSARTTFRPWARRELREPPRVEHLVLGRRPPSALRRKAPALGHAYPFERAHPDARSPHCAGLTPGPAAMPAVIEPHLGARQAGVDGRPRRYQPRRGRGDASRPTCCAARRRRRRGRHARAAATRRSSRRRRGAAADAVGAVQRSSARPHCRCRRRRWRRCPR